MADIIQMEDSASPDERTPTGWHRFWDKEVRAARKRLDRFTRQGNRIVDRYIDRRGDGTSTTRLNLFHTNVRTLMSMLYGSKPQIDVSREHQDPSDDVARVASNLFQRILESDTDPSGQSLNCVLKNALQDRLLPGIGTARVRYDMQTTETQDPMTQQMVETLAWEDAPVDYVHWQDFLWGWCRTWDEMPWQGFRVWMDKDQATSRFGEKKAKTLEYKNQIPAGDKDNSETLDSDQENSVRKAEIWEIWNKMDKKVYWYHEGIDTILDSKDDPLKLDGFWSTPLPLIANTTTTLFEPTADYHLAQDLYNQIDVIATRITIITKAVKVVGVYNKGEVGVKRMLQEGVENDLIPVDNWAMFAEKGGLKGAIDWFPTETVVATLATLRQLESDLIDTLYQVTGMSDILRGANTDQYASDGTQQLKAKFGSISVQALQDDFARFASDLEALKAEIIAKHFDPKTILQQSGARFMPEADHDKIQPALELMKSPEIKWRINIRPETIAMIDYAQLRDERTAFLTGMATFLQSGQAVMKQIPESTPILMEMLKWAMAGFKGADYLEGIMDQGIEAAKKAKPKDDGEGAKLEGEMQKLQMQNQLEMQKIQAKSQADMQVFQAKTQGELQKIQMDNQANISELQQKAQGDQQKIVADLRADLRIIAEKLSADLQREEIQSAMAIAEEEVQHDNNMTEIRANDSGDEE